MSVMNGKCHRFIAKESGSSRRGVQAVLKRWKGSGESKYQFQSGRKRKSTKRSDATLVILSLADKKLAFKKLAKELQDSTGVELSAPATGKWSSRMQG